MKGIQDPSSGFVKVYRELNGKVANGFRERRVSREKQVSTVIDKVQELPNAKFPAAKVYVPRGVSVSETCFMHARARTFEGRIQGEDIVKAAFSKLKELWGSRLEFQGVPRVCE